MPSDALVRWRAEGLEQLDELEAVHLQVAGGTPGRKWGTRQLNRGLLVALCAQFQAYCRDLHDLAVATHRDAAIPEQKSMIDRLLTENRQLDRGNARTDSLGADFGRLAVPLIQLLNQKEQPTTGRLVRLDRLADFRNAIAHGNEAQIAVYEAQGHIASTKASYTAHRSALNALASTIDRVVGDQLALVLAIPKPW